MSPPQQRLYPEKPRAVYFFGTCLMDVIYPEAGLAAVELIERQGVRVIYPQGQTCCAQPPFNSGYWAEAREVAAQQIALFPEDLPVVVPSGSCGAMMRMHYPRLFDDAGPGAAERARAFAGRVYEWSEFMVNVLGVALEDRGPPLRVTYHPSCHLLRELGQGAAPLELLGQLRHVELRPLEEAEECCGFGGTFSVKYDEVSGAMVGDKCRHIVASGAEVVVSADSGCLMNIAGALQAAGERVAVKPLPQFLKERLDGAQPAAV